MESPEFLRVELEEFNKIYTELLSTPTRSRRPSAELEQALDDLTELTDLAVNLGLCNVRRGVFNDLCYRRLSATRDRYSSGDYTPDFSITNTDFSLTGTGSDPTQTGSGCESTTGSDNYSH